MRSNVKVSVIITIYNIEKYITECVNSIQNQTIKDIEIICVDDCSTDASYAVLEELKKDDDRIVLVHHKENKGPSSARNSGSKIAMGEYIYWMDGDDMLEENALEYLYNLATSQKLQLITFNGDSFADDECMLDALNRKKNRYIRSGEYEGVYKGAELFACIADNGDHFGNMCMNFVEGDFYRANDFYGIDGLRFGEDDPFKIYMMAERAMAIPDIFYKDRCRKSSLVTSKRRFVDVESVLIIMLEDMKFLQECKLEYTLYSRIEYHFRMKYSMILKMLQDISDDERQINLLQKFPLAHFIYDYFIEQKSILCTNLTPKLLDELKGKKIIVYGAGMVAQDAVNILHKNGIVDFVIAESKKKEDNFCGYKVHNIDELVDINHDSVVLIATMRRHYKDIKSNLHKLGFRNYIELS